VLHINHCDFSILVTKILGTWIAKIQKEFFRVRDRYIFRCKIAKFQGTLSKVIAHTH
jgi:hypothetical protein